MRHTMHGSVSRRARRWIPAAHRLLLIGIGLGLFALAVAGCGQTSNAGASPQNCGTVVVRANSTPTGTTATQAENCFYQAYQHCASATLTVNEMGVDAGTDRTFTTVSRSGGCAISESVTTYVVPRGQNPTTTYTCTGLSQQSDGLHFSSCGADGNIFVPAPAAG